MVENESVEQICSRIREDGEKEITSILDKANRTAADIVAKAEERGKAGAEKILKEAEEKGKLTQRRLLSSVNLEVKRAKLRSREEVVSNVNEKVGEALGALRDGSSYADTLARLACEGVRALGGEQFIIFADRRDTALVEKDVVQNVKKTMAGEGFTIGEIEVQPLEHKSLGGVKVGAPGGRVVYDNTFEARIYRLRDEIRNVIFKEVFAPEQSEESSSA